MKAARLYVLGVVGALVGVWAMAVVGCANEQQQKLTPIINVSSTQQDSYSLLL